MARLELRNLRYLPHSILQLLLVQAPKGLERVLAFAQDNEREFMQGVKHGLGMAAKDQETKIYRRSR